MFIESATVEFHYYDANCLVKLVLNEPGSDVLKKHFYARDSIPLTTNFCFYEALGVMKAKWVQKNRSDKISEEQYLASCEEL